LQPCQLSGAQIGDDVEDIHSLHGVFLEAVGRQELRIAMHKAPHEHLLLEQEEEQIENQVVQTKDQITGSSRQLAATQYQSALLIDELADVQTLFDKGLAQASRVSALKRERARLLGEVGQFEARIAQLEGNIARLEIEKLRLRSVRREQAIASLRDLSVQEIELAERELSTRDTLSKMAMRTPVSGVIYGSRVFAVQSVISPADPVMYVIPQDQPLIVAARIAAIHIDQVHVGQDAALRFSAFDQRTTPEIFGTVSKISADVYTDEVSGQTYYLANLVPKSGELAKLDTQVLLPGMPVETFIRTVERSPFSYLVKPLMDYFNKAFRED
jgi:HlyD family type I secretion membrane fusion protein